MIHSTRKTTVGKLKKRNIVCSDITKAATGHKGVNFLNDYDEADEEEQQWLSCNIQNEVMRKSKYWQFPTSQQLWLNSPDDGSVKRKQITTFIFGF